MARTAGVINGTALGLYVSTNLVAISTTCSLSQKMEIRDTTNKDSGGFKSGLKGVKSWSIECSALVAFDETYNAAWLQGLYTTGAEVAVKIATTNGDDYYYTGNAIISSLKVDAPMEQNATFSATFNGSGTLSLVDPLS